MSRTAPALPGIRLTPDREEMISVAGGHIYVRINGDLHNGRPPIVMVHGGPGSSHWYFLNATALADERAVILYDQLDSGRSDCPGDPANWTVSRFVDELEAIRAYLGIERWHVLGTSWGGLVVLEYGARQPQALAGLIVQSPLITTEKWLEDANRLKDAMPPEIRDLLYRCDTPGAASEAECAKATEAFYRRHIYLADPTPEIAAYKASLPRAFNAEIYNHMWGRAEFTASGTLKHYEGRPLLARLDGRRTLFVTGEADEAIPETVAAFARMAGADFAVIPDAAHFAMNDNAPAYLAILRPWLLRQDA
ncbi:MAG TPA: proline iminopeptidase-family hydrolase [Sphingomonas sp.]|uniref:proline iminopeptidase-family hydrolase n=1 Tax=Sphingomonas sp. TaxID=28214 RepID=UPI002BDB4E8B|nr:proline iminopeptidase-family hydrolase [Sphingomonas sp.]HMI19865.1 proline iminopeptidase-family hydrolase [Sphingomonas sp.]